MLRATIYLAIAFVFCMTVVRPFVKGEDMAFEVCQKTASDAACVYAFR